MPKPLIYLDMDGVCTDFVSAALRLHGVEPEAFLARWPEGQFDMATVMGISQNAFWKPIGKAGHEFWTGLEAYPWFIELFGVCNQIADVAFLTSPSLDPFAASGKVAWLQERFGTGFRAYNITNQKWRCARPNAILIDDHPDHCTEFREHGGQAVLFPAIWNKRRPKGSFPLALVISEIRAAVRKVS